MNLQLKEFIKKYFTSNIVEYFLEYDDNYIPLFEILSDSFSKINYDLAVRIVDQLIKKNNKIKYIQYFS